MRLNWLAAGLFIFPVNSEAQTSWQPMSQTQMYSVTGGTPVDLYASIGENGPKVGAEVRAIAHTSFKLLWSRKYEPQPSGACTLVSARPSLTLIYTLPKATSPLSADLRKRWDVFITGVRKHELIHGAMITDMVKEIEAYSVGLSVPDDPKCTKIRTVLTAKLGEISGANRKRHSDFDRMEMGDGGNVHQLILQFVNPR